MTRKDIYFWNIVFFASSARKKCNYFAKASPILGNFCLHRPLVGLMFKSSQTFWRITKFCLYELGTWKPLRPRLEGSVGLAALINAHVHFTIWEWDNSLDPNNYHRLSIYVLFSGKGNCCCTHESGMKSWVYNTISIIILIC